MKSKRAQSAPARKGTVVVAEIGQNWFKLAQLQLGKRGVQVEKLHVEHFEQLGGALSVRISRTVKEMKIGNNPVLGVLPRQLANLRVLELPSSDVEEIESMVDLQIGRQTPHSREDILSDYCQLSGRRQGYSRVMLSIVPRSVLGQRFTVLDVAGLEMQRMALSSEGILAAYRDYIDAQKVASVALIDVDASSTEVLVVENGEMVFSRSIMLGGEALRNEPGSEQSLVAEIARSIEIHHEEGGAPVERAAIAGSQTGGTGLIEGVEQRLGVSVDSLDLKESVDFGKNAGMADEADSRGVSFSALIGSALARDNLVFDLTPDAVRVKKTIESRYKSLRNCGVLIMAAVFFTSLWVLAKMYDRRRHLDLLDDEIYATSGASDLEKKEGLVRVTAARIARPAVVDLMHALQKETPEAIHFTSFDLEPDGQMTLEGIGSTITDVQSLVQRP